MTVANLPRGLSSTILRFAYLLFKDGQTHGRFRLTSPLTRRLRAISKFYVRRLLRFTTLYRLVVSV